MPEDIKKHDEDTVVTALKVFIEDSVDSKSLMDLFKKNKPLLDGLKTTNPTRRASIIESFNKKSKDFDEEPI